MASEPPDKVWPDDRSWYARKVHLLNRLLDLPINSAWTVPERQVHLLDELRALVAEKLVFDRSDRRGTPHTFVISPLGERWLREANDPVNLLRSAAEEAEQRAANERRIAENKAHDRAVLERLRGDFAARLQYAMHGPLGPRGYKP